MITSKRLELLGEVYILSITNTGPVNRVYVVVTADPKGGGRRGGGNRDIEFIP